MTLRFAAGATALVVMIAAPISAQTILYRATEGPVYEYACHEGNYATPDIRGGAHKLESQENK